MLFEHVEFSVDSSSRIVLLGENGNGKTTLAKLMLGQLTPTVGEVSINPHSRTAIVNQHHADQLDLTLTPLEFMKRTFPGDGRCVCVYVCVGGWVGACVFVRVRTCVRGSVSGKKRFASTYKNTHTPTHTHAHTRTRQLPA